MSNRKNRNKESCGFCYSCSRGEVCTNPNIRDYVGIETESDEKNQFRGRKERIRTRELIFSLAEQQEEEMYEK